MLNEEVKLQRVSQMIKQKNHKHSGKVGRVAWKVKKSDEFFSRVRLSRSNIYFKICLYNFLCKFPTWKKSILTSSYFKSNFKLVKKACKANVDIFGAKKVLVWSWLLYSVEILFSAVSLETFIKCIDFYLVRRLL